MQSARALELWNDDIYKPIYNIVKQIKPESETKPYGIYQDFYPYLSKFSIFFIRKNKINIPQYIVGAMITAIQKGKRNENIFTVYQQNVHSTTKWPQHGLPEYMVPVSIVKFNIRNSDTNYTSISDKCHWLSYVRLDDGYWIKTDFLKDDKSIKIRNIESELKNYSYTVIYLNKAYLKSK